MTRARVHETGSGITGEFNVHAYNEMMRTLRDRNWIETDMLLRSGITLGWALEIGPGPGYLGLEWLRRTTGTRLTGVDISADMLALARKNAEEYRLSDRAQYVLGDARALPFADASFDNVFTNGSLHEWERPEEIFSEVQRVLRQGGRYLVTDLRRDMPLPVKLFLWLVTKPRVMRRGLVTSINSSYTVSEARQVVGSSPLENWSVTSNPLGLVIQGSKSL